MPNKAGFCIFMYSESVVNDITVGNYKKKATNAIFKR